MKQAVLLLKLCHFVDLLKCQPIYGYSNSLLINWLLAPIVDTVYVFQCSQYFYRRILRIHTVGA